MELYKVYNVENTRAEKQYCANWWARFTNP